MRGYSGYNSRWALDVLKFGLLTPNNPDLYSMATIFFGANDAVLSDESQHCPLDEYKQNISSMVDILREHNSRIELILITPGTVDHSRWDSRHPDQVSQYADAVRDVGVDKNVPVVDLWKDEIAFDLSTDFDDGLHLSPSGNAKVFDGVIQAIQNSYPQSIPDEHQLHFPDWKELKNVSASDELKGWAWTT